MQPSQRSRARRRLIKSLKQHRRTLFWSGFTLAAAAAAVAVFPDAAILLVGVAAGWLLWLAGATMMGITTLIGRGRSMAIGLAVGLATICAGALLMLHPFTGALATTLLIAGVLVMEGALELTLALDLRPLRAWRWVLVSALASAVAGVATAAGATGGSDFALAMVLAIALASTGVALMRTAHSASRPRPARAPRRASPAPPARRTPAHP